MPTDRKSQFIHLLRLEHQHVSAMQTTLSGNPGKRKRCENWSEAVAIFIRFARVGPSACMKQNCSSPGGVGAIYSGDDTWAGNIKKCLKEASGSDVKRQVVEFMYETVSIKKEGSKMQRTLVGHACVETRKGRTVPVRLQIKTIIFFFYSF